MLSIRRQTVSIALLLAVLVNCGLAPVVGRETSATVAQPFYVAPMQAGDGRGVSQTSAASFRDMTFEVL